MCRCISPCPCTQPGVTEPLKDVNRPPAAALFTPQDCVRSTAPWYRSHAAASLPNDRTCCCQHTHTLRLPGT